MEDKQQLVIFEQNNMLMREVKGEYYLTSKEIGYGLGYEYPQESIDKIFDRNKEELEPYSVQVKLTGTDGKQYDMRAFKEEGIYLITMLAKTPKAKEFRIKVAKLLKELRHRKLNQARLEGATQALAYYQILKKQGRDVTFARRIIYYRRLGLTQRDTAKLLDAARETVRDHEKILRASGLWEELA